MWWKELARVCFVRLVHARALGGEQKQGAHQTSEQDVQNAPIIEFENQPSSRCALKEREQSLRQHYKQANGCPPKEAINTRKAD